MATDFKRGDTGINTAEGQISGPRAARLAKQRQADQQDYESKKQKIQVCAYIHPMMWQLNRVIR